VRRDIDVQRGGKETGLGKGENPSEYRKGGFFRSVEGSIKAKGDIRVKGGEIKGGVNEK